VGVFTLGGMDPDDAQCSDTGGLSLATEVEAHVITIIVRGELDANNAMALSSRMTVALDEAAGRRILIDLEQLEHFGSAGIAVLVQAHRRAHERGVPFRVITGDNAIVTRPLATMKLDNVLRLYPTRATALA
jgi:anti-sigma B factor antagonist